RGDERPRYYANDHSRDRVSIAPQAMPLTNGRAARPTLAHHGFALVTHDSAVADWHDAVQVAAVHPGEIIALLTRATQADHIIVTSPGILRFSERSAHSGTGNNSAPARFAHVDVSTPTAIRFAERSAPEGRTPVRFAHFNVWRALSPPPQDVPLAVCDATSVAAHDLIAADAIFDEPGKPDWGFEGYVVAHNPAHRWFWFPDMRSQDALIFRTYDSATPESTCVPHVAFDNPACPPDAPPRISIEMRASAYWF
ncbi:MAG: hypothetical protein KGJ05_06160, partial [Alphaproteobacteria bacterium]|nr:hypothetical protein [Alphaproteobacteria bacterium]